jgi:hypothetical protein
MKRIFLASLLAALLFCCAKHSEAQTIQYVYSAVTHNSTTVSTSCGDFLSSCNIIGTGAQYHQLSWNVTGTLSACSVRVDSSADGVTWNIGDIVAAQTCTANGNAISTAQTVNFTRINITSITPVGSASLTTNLTGYANNPSGGGGGGTVTSFSAGTLSPLFTTSVATPTTTPALSFSLSNAAAGTVYGNNTGGSAAPAYQTNIALTQGSIVANTPTINSTQTWNAAGATFTNILFNTTCTAAAISSKLIDMQIAGVSALNLVFGAANCGTSTTLNIGKTGAGGIVGLVGGTSGTATCTGPAVAGTVTNPVTCTNDFSVPGYILNGGAGVANTSGIFGGAGSNIILTWGNGAAGNTAFTIGNQFLEIDPTKISMGTGNLIISNTAPTISAGFGTSPSIVNANSTASFEINVGTGGAASTGTIGLPIAAHSWYCNCEDVTTSSSTVFRCKQTGAGTTTTAPIGQFTAAGAAQAWTASDILEVSCHAN